MAKETNTFTANGKIKRTLQSMVLAVTEDEKDFRKQSEITITEKGVIEKLKCTKCSGKCQTNNKPFSIHPLLNVPFCAKCIDFYGDGEFSLDEDDEDKYCRWCGEGGQLFICSKCICGFCPKCLKKHLGKTEAKAIEDDDDWICLICNPKPLYKLRHITSVARETTPPAPVLKRSRKSIDNSSDKGDKNKVSSAQSRKRARTSGSKSDEESGKNKSDSSDDSDTGVKDKKNSSRKRSKRAAPPKSGSDSDSEVEKRKKKKKQSFSSDSDSDKESKKNNKPPVKRRTSKVSGTEKSKSKKRAHSTSSAKDSDSEIFDSPKKPKRQSSVDPFDALLSEDSSKAYTDQKEVNDDKIVSPVKNSNDSSEEEDSASKTASVKTPEPRDEREASPAKVNEKTPVEEHPDEIDRTQEVSCNNSPSGESIGGDEIGKEVDPLGDNDKTFEKSSLGTGEADDEREKSIMSTENCDEEKGNDSRDSKVEEGKTETDKSKENSAEGCVKGKGDDDAEKGRNSQLNENKLKVQGTEKGIEKLPENEKLTESIASNDSKNIVTTTSPGKRKSGELSNVRNDREKEMQEVKKFLQTVGSKKDDENCGLEIVKGIVKETNKRLDSNSSGKLKETETNCIEGGKNSVEDKAEDNDQKRDTSSLLENKVVDKVQSAKKAHEEISKNNNVNKCESDGGDTSDKSNRDVATKQRNSIGPASRKDRNISAKPKEKLGDKSKTIEKDSGTDESSAARKKSSDDPKNDDADEPTSLKMLRKVLLLSTLALDHSINQQKMIQTTKVSYGALMNEKKKFSNALTISELSCDLIQHHASSYLNEKKDTEQVLSANK